MSTDRCEPRSRTGSSASAAPSASDNSSALSDALSVEPAHSTRTGDTDSIIEDSHDENETVDDTILASGEDDMSDVGGHVTFDCLYCAKAYATSQGLKRHVKDKRTTCARERLTVREQEPEHGWQCTRCHAQMSKRYSVERHIKDSCFKTCDECCEAGNIKCDGHSKEGDCNNCIEAGRSCTKHTEEVYGCEAKILSGPPAEPFQPGRKSKRFVPQRSTRVKRKPSDSPELSPQSKPVPKRTAAAGRNKKVAHHRTEVVLLPEDSPPISPSSPQDDSTQDPLRSFRLCKTIPLPNMGSEARNNRCPDPLRGHRDDLGSALPLPLDVPQAPRYPRFPQQPHLHSNLATVYPPISQGQYQSVHARGFSNVIGQREPSIVSGMPNPRTLGSGFFDMQEGGYDPARMNQVMQQQLLRQQHYLQQMNMAARQGSDIGAERRLPQIATSRQSIVNTGGRRIDLEALHPPESRVARFRPAQTGSSTRAAPKDVGHEKFLASAPGSRMPSVEPPPEREIGLRGLPRRQLHEQLQELGHAPGVHDGGEINKDVVAHLNAQSMVQDPDEPTLKLKIHSNIYDTSDNAIFSILSIRPSQKLGPRLEAYCQQRQKVYGVDWIFVYRFRVPTDTHAQYIPIKYDMTPSELMNQKPPGAALSDVDTIYVMGRTNNHKNGGGDIMQPSRETVDIINGENHIYQDTKVMATWVRKCEEQMNKLRIQKAELMAMTSQQQRQITQQANTIANLQMRSNRLSKELQQRSNGFSIAGVPHHHRQGMSGSVRTVGGQHAAVHHLPKLSFMSQLESVRDPKEAMQRQRIDPLQFPTHYLDDTGLGLHPEHEHEHQHERTPHLFQNRYPTPEFQPLRLGGHDPHQDLPLRRESPVRNVGSNVTRNEEEQGENQE